MELYILLLLLLIGCTTVIQEFPNNAIEENNIIVNETINKTILKSKYEGFYGVFNFTEFKIEDCGSLIKHYNLVLAEEDSRLNKRKFNVRDAREELKIAIGSNENKTIIQELNKTVIAKEIAFKETNEYFAKVRYSLRLIKDECNRLTSD